MTPIAGAPKPLAAELDRALGALYGLAMGDALGMPTQELSQAHAQRILGPVADFRPGPPENPISHGLPAGSVTDDTLQALLIGRLLVDGGGRIDPLRLARELLEWEREMAALGRAELLGPSTRRALQAVAAGADPGTTGGRGVTNGAAMRITPVGIATPPTPLDRLVAAVTGAGKVTHETGIANAGAAAVAMVISCGVAGLTFDAALSPAVEAASLAATFGQDFNEDHVATQILRAFEIAVAQRDDPARALDSLVGEIGTGVAIEQSVPAAFGVAALAPGDSWRACVMAAGLGGDTDTIAAIAGAMVGACNGLATLPAAAVVTIRSVNGLDLQPLAEQLLALRRRLT
ncbi:MAG TPA: ADP-ribosylglycohydrolase family protein [Candidatus Dormibacteraeota bacterium]|jgi:ADP-ribosylglycohydrolase